MEKQHTAVCVDIPHRRTYRMVRSVERYTTRDPPLGPAIFIGAAVYFVIQFNVAWVFIPIQFGFKLNLTIVTVTGTARTLAVSIDDVPSASRKSAA